ncbi:MAG: lipid II flippase MurJ [Ramlibacter sp.]
MKLLHALRGRIQHADPGHHLIARGMAWVALFVLVSSLARAAKEMAIAYRYGVSAEVDAYLFIFNLVSWPVAVWFSLLTVVLVPMASRIRQDACGVEGLPRFRGELLGLALAVGLALLVVAWLGLPLLLKSPWSGLAPATLAIALPMVPALALLAPLGIVISVFSAWMLAASRHQNTLMEGIPSLAVLLALLAFSGGGTEPLVWGTVAGFALHLAGLAVPLARQGEIAAPRFSRASPHWKPFWQGFGLMAAGQTLMSFTGVIDQFFASHLGTGAVATLGYANRILALLLGLGAVAVSRATLPVFSDMQAQAGEQLRRVAAHWARLLFAVGVVAVLAAWWLAPWGVQILFERGAFVASDTVLVADILRLGLLQLPFYFSGLVLVSLLVSLQKYRSVATVAAINFVVKVAANVVLAGMFGLQGIVLATALMYLVSMVLCLVAVRNAR